MRALTIARTHAQYVTNVVALYMTFYPIEFYPAALRLYQPEGRPFGLFGWQGIIPAKAGKMAEIMVELMTTKLIDIKDVFNRLDPKRMSELLSDGAKDTMRKIVDEVGGMQLPTLWSCVPDSVREELVFILSRDTDRYVEGLMAELKRDIENVMDLKHLVVTKALSRKEVVVDMFQQVGAKEFHFIRVSGFYFGFLFGIVQSGVFYAYEAWWLLPVGGFIVGYITNYLALKVIFEPIEPIHICGYALQGLFLKRQDEVSVMFAKLSSEHFLRAHALWGEILQGARFDAFKALVERYTTDYITRYLGASRIPAILLLGKDGLDAIALKMSELIVADLPNSMPASYAYTEEAMMIESTIDEKLRKLPPKEFEGVLHPGESLLSFFMGALLL